MLLSDIDNWSVLALHQISTDLAAERITIDSLDDELDTIGQLPGWDSQAADQARNRLSTARTGLMDDRLVLQTVETLAEETATQLTGLKDELADIREIVESHNGRMQLSDSGEVTVTESGRTISQFRAIAEELETRAKKLIADAEALDLDCAEVLDRAIGTERVYRVEEFMEMNSGGDIYLDGTDGDDHFIVEQNGQHAIRITMNPGTEDARSEIYSIAEADGLIIDSGDGDDIIEIEPHISGVDTSTGIRVDPTFRIEAGRGNDRVNSSSGRDYINGGSGDDVIDSGRGDDVVYAGDGNDYVLGASGFDYIDGGRGDDVLDGSSDNDLVHGGLGNDLIRAGWGDDRVFTGDGLDRVSNESGHDIVIAQTGDLVQSVGGTNDRRDIELAPIPVDNITVADYSRPEGGYSLLFEFEQRVRDDLELLRSTESGQAMFDAIASSNAEVVIMNEGGPSSFAYMPDQPSEGYEREPGQMGIGYSTRFVDSAPVFGSTDTEDDDTTFTPVATLFHEMAHIYDFANGGPRDDYYVGRDKIDVNNQVISDRYGDPALIDSPVLVAERVATGLPIDHDNDARTPEQIAPEHPIELTENGLRAELGLAQREHYGQGVPPLPR